MLGYAIRSRDGKEPWFIKRQGQICLSLVPIIFILTIILVSVLMTNQPKHDDIAWVNHNWTVLCTFPKEEKKLELGNIISNQTFCNQLCSSNPSCTHYVWSKQKNGTCFLKSGSTHKSKVMRDPDHNTICGVKDIHWTKKNWAKRCEFVTSVFAEIRSPFEDCELACQYLSNCTHFNWKPANNGTCQFMSGKVELANAHVTADESNVCGIVGKGVTVWQEDDSASSCEFKGNSFLNTRSERWECKPACDKNPNCNHFFWSDGVCSLKSGRIRPEDALLVNDQSFLCGFIRDRLY